MKPLRLVSTIIVLGSLAATPALRADDEASHKAAAEELLKVMHSEQGMEDIIDRVSQSADRLMPPIRSSATPEEEAKFRDSLRQQAKDILKEQLSWQTMEPAIADLYVADFSEAELKQLADFYKTPVGQKLAEKQPDLMTKSMQLTQQKVRTAVPLLSQKLRPSITKFREDHPPVVPPRPPLAPPGAPASPGASPGSSPSAAIPPRPAPAPPVMIVSPTPAPSVAATPAPSATPVASPSSTPVPPQP